jgi:formylglycine-generating enzyme required for sulfatase activity
VRTSTPYAAQGYRLPTEAEWEYACRAGTDTAFNNGTDCLSADTEANYRGTGPLSACPIGIDRGETIEAASLPAGENDFGLYDMHGNVWEWCNDWYGSYGGDETDPVGESSGSDRVIRGGSWNSLAQNCRSANRNGSNPDNSFNLGGFRPVRSAF